MYNTGQDNSNSSEASNSSKVSKEPKANDGSLELPSMSVAFSKPSSLEDLTFLETKSLPDTSSSVEYVAQSLPIVFFSRASLDTIPECKLSDKGGALGALWKIPGQYPTEPTVDNTPGTLVKQFPDFYLAYRRPAMSCTSDASLETKINSAQDSLNNALKDSVQLLD